MDLGNPTYACGTAAARRVPWLLMVQLTVPISRVALMILGATACRSRTTGEEVVNDPP